MPKPKRVLVPLLAISKGQMAIVFTLVAVTMIGAMALGTDVGVFYVNWVRLQKAADSAVLAGANYLPNDTATAKSTAITFAKANGVSASEISTPTLSPDNTGSSSGGTSVSGTPVNPVCGTTAGQYDVLPIAVSSQTASQFVQGNSYTLNRTGDGGSWVDAPGNWGFVQLCQSNNGDSALRNAVTDGYYGPVSIGQALTTVPGVRGASLNGALDGRLSSSDNPGNFDPGVDPRAVIIPMVSGFSTCTGSCTVTITGFLAFYIDSTSGSAVTGHFIKMEAFTSIGTGTGADAGVTGNPILVK